MKYVHIHTHVYIYIGDREGLVGDILRTLVGAMPQNIPTIMNVDGSEEQKIYRFLPQDVLQPFCARFSSIPAARRVTLLKTALDALGPCALPGTIYISVSFIICMLTFCLCFRLVCIFVWD
jgi:hypothetical protein